MARPRLGEGKKVPVTVYLEPELVAHCERVGEGSASVGLRELARQNRALMEGEEGPVVDVREEPIPRAVPQPQPVASSLKPKRVDPFPREKWCAGCQRKGAPTCDQCRKQWCESRPSLGGG